MIDTRLSAAERGSFLTRSSLQLVLMSTEQCNCRCTYCYEDFALGAMAPEVVEGVKALMRRRMPELKRLAIDWFGGEPLLAWKTVIEVQEFAHDLVGLQAGTTLISSITTNGVLLTPDRFRRLLSLGVGCFRVTLDGPRDVHDRYRVRRSGHGTFDAIWRNLSLIREIDGDYRVFLRLHVTRENLSRLPGFIEEVARDFGEWHRFWVSLKAVRPLGGPNDGVLPLLTPGERAVLVDLRKAARAAGLRVEEPPTEVSTPGALRGCYAAAANSLVVRSNGDLAKCTVAFNNERNRVGKLLPDGTVDLDSGKMLYWMQGVFTGNLKLLQCPAQAGTGPVATAPEPHRRVLPVV